MSGEASKREVGFDDSGFTITPYQKPEIHVYWADIREVFAFKHDLFSVDEICFGFRLDDAGLYVWVSEDDRGFQQFQSEVERRFSIPVDWFGKVAYPAFKENRTTLWERKS